MTSLTANTIRIPEVASSLDPALTCVTFKTMGRIQVTTQTEKQLCQHLQATTSLCVHLTFLILFLFFIAFLEFAGHFLF